MLALSLLSFALLVFITKLINIIEKVQCLLSGWSGSSWTAPVGRICVVGAIVVNFLESFMMFDRLIYKSFTSDGHSVIKH